HRDRHHAHREPLPPRRRRRIRGARDRLRRRAHRHACRAARPARRARAASRPRPRTRRHGLTPVRLDHVALPTRDAGAPLATLVGELGGTVLSGGLAVGYRPMQVHLGDARSGMKVELLEPWAVESNDFLDRFLTRHGDGPHHLTYKVDDLDATL